MHAAISTNMDAVNLAILGMITRSLRFDWLIAECPAAGGHR
jgi:hypothetical protein